MKKHLLLLPSTLFVMLILPACQSTMTPTTPTMTAPDTSSCLTIGYHTGTYTLTNFRIQCQRFETVHYPFEGLIQDQNSKAGLGSVNITLEQLQETGYQPIKTLISNESGQFSLDSLAEGDYRLVLSKDTYKQLERRFKFSMEFGPYGGTKPNKPAAVLLLMEKAN